MKFLLLPLFLTFSTLSAQSLLPQNSKLVADQTFRMDGTHEFTYALAQGDQVTLHVQELSGKKIKSIEFVQFPDNMIFRAYELDSSLTRILTIPQTGVYRLRFSETGLGKKVCRFTLHRLPGSEETRLFDTRVLWNLSEFPRFQLLRRTIESGLRTDVVSIGGHTTVAASRLGLRRAISTYQFTLPPNTVRWAYRLAVGQAVTEARRQDAEQFSKLLKQGAAKSIKYQPETALAAFALGMAVDMTTSTSGENVEYAIIDGENLTYFLKGEEYRSFLQQSSVAVDVQRRYAPLTGTYYFALKSDNWIEAIDVTIDIEAVTETPLLDTELYLAPVKE